jgi:uncharacterized membrane protein YhaH (DUF805 family)
MSPRRRSSDAIAAGTSFRGVIMTNQKMSLSQLYFSLDGRINRQVFWVNYLVFLVLPVAVISSVVDIRLGYRPTGGPAYLVSCLLLFWPSLAMQAKRWHDIDKSAWWILVGIIPIIGAIWALVANGFLRGTQGRNRFGDDPLPT